MSWQWQLHIISRPSTISENSSQLKAYPPLWCPTMALHSMEKNSCMPSTRSSPFKTPKWINIHQIHQRLIEIQNTQKEQFDRAHRAKDLWVLKVNKQVQFFPNQKGTGPSTWLTGTVTEILDCGHSYMIQGPNSRVYRKNRAHLKPICYNGTSFQDNPVKKRGKEAWNQLLSRPQAHKGENHVLPNGHQIHGWQIHFLLWSQHTSDTSFITITTAAILTQVTITFTSCI